MLSKKKEKLTVREGNGRVEVKNLSSHVVFSPAEATALMDAAATSRSKSNTVLNSISSRSHAIYSLTLHREGEMPVVFEVVDLAGAYMLLLYFIKSVYECLGAHFCYSDTTKRKHHHHHNHLDLAGAERGNRTKANSAQQKEANIINMSLMQLWRCLESMKRKNASDGSNNTDIIPFRESKLTHLLMPQLAKSGLSGVAMITCVNPQVDDYDETISILNNASLASKIREITELRPITVQAQPTASTRNISNNNVSTAGVLKRKRGEGSVVTGKDGPIAATSKRSSTILTKTVSASASTSAPVVQEELEASESIVSDTGRISTNEGKFNFSEKYVLMSCNH